MNSDLWMDQRQIVSGSSSALNVRKKNEWEVGRSWCSFKEIGGEEWDKTIWEERVLKGACA